MPLSAVTEGSHPFEFLRSEANGRRSRENLVIDQNQTIKPGTVLGLKSLGAATVTAAAFVSGSNGVPGNGAFSAMTADAGAPAGDYKVIITNPVANAGAFEVFKPDGSLDGVGSVGVAYNGTIN
ncbi:MAG: head decoration protein, partial [Proteobacteria bacterium]|nr:head decoration protein [Pseudomonadota bacterium]